MDIYWKATLLSCLISTILGFIASKRDKQKYRVVCGLFALLSVSLGIIGIALEAAIAVGDVCK